jgi:colicin import membrane protein
MKLLATACLVAVALGTPDHLPHTVQTDKKALTKDAKEERAKRQEEIKRIEPIIVHSQMSKDQEAQLAKDVSEVEKMRKALAQAEHQAVEVKTESQAAEVPTKAQTPAPQAKAAKEAAPVAAAKADASKAPKVAEQKVAAVEPKKEQKVAVEPKKEHKVEVTKKVKPEAKPPAHEKAAVAAAPAKSGAVAEMKQRLAEAEAKGEQKAIAKLSSTSQKHASKKTNLRRTPIMRPRNFAKTVEQWEAGNPVGSKGMLHAGKVHLSHPHIAALPAVKAMPWTSTPSPVTTNATAVNLGAEKKVSGDVASPEVIAKFTESAQASAERAHKHLEEAKKAFAKTSENADKIHETGKKIEHTAGTIKYLYSTPEPPPPPTTQAPPAPKQKSAAYSPRSFLVASLLALGAVAWAC